MFSISFEAAVIAIAQIFAMGVLGYVLVIKRVVDEGGLKLLSFLSVNVCFPLFIFYQIIHHFNPNNTPYWWGYPLINIALTLTGLCLTTLIFRGKAKDEVLAVCSLQNAGYIPLLIATTLPLGEASGEVYTAIMLSVIGFDICLWSLGVWLVTRQHIPCMELKKVFNPPLISMGLAIAIVLLGGQTLIPEAILRPTKIIGDSALAVAMLVIGGNLAMTNLSDVKWAEISGVVLTKLVLLPMVALTASLILPLGALMSFVLVLQACMPTSISISVIGRHYGTANQGYINRSIFFTHMICVITVPLFLALYGTLNR